MQTEDEGLQGEGPSERASPFARSRVDMRRCPRSPGLPRVRSPGCRIPPLDRHRGFTKVARRDPTTQMAPCGFTSNSCVTGRRERGQPQAPAGGSTRCPGSFWNICNAPLHPMHSDKHIEEALLSVGPEADLQVVTKTRFLLSHTPGSPGAASWLRVGWSPLTVISVFTEGS